MVRNRFDTITGERNVRPPLSVRGLMLVVMLGAFLLMSLPPRAAASSSQFCSAFQTTDRTVVVSKMTTNPTCVVAAAITRNVLSGRGVTRHGGPANAENWYSLKRFPGWRCDTGAGGAGECRKGARRIGWEMARGRIPLTPAVEDRGVWRVAPVGWIPFRVPRLGLGIAFSSLRWTGWGRPVASATGRMRVCAGGDCSVHSGRIEVRKPGYSYEVNRIQYRCLRFVSVPDVPEIDRSWAIISGDMSDRCPA